MANILVVGDDKDRALLYKKGLTEEGYRVFIARNGKEAVFMLGLTPPDIVVLDINIPRMDSIEVMGKILGENNGVPLVINATGPDFKDSLSALKRAIKEILEKTGMNF